MRMPFVLLTRALLAGPFLLAGFFQPVQAAKLWQVLETAQKDCTRVAQALKTAGLGTSSGEDPANDCAAAVTQLYMSSLRHREQQGLLQTAIKEQRTLLEVVQRLAESGALSNADILIAEIALKRLQLLEAEHVTARHHNRLVFESVLASDPAQFIAPVISAEDWPEDEAAAISMLTSSAPDSTETQRRLKHAWADYQGAQRRRNLLQPMNALSGDLADSTMQRFELGRITVTQLSERMNDALQHSLALADAENELLAARLRVLAVLGRTGEIE